MRATISRYSRLTEGKWVVCPLLKGHPSCKKYEFYKPIGAQLLTFP